MSDQPFEIFTVSPIHLCPPTLAIATVNAGGSAFLDREFCADDALDVAAQNLRQLLSTLTAQSLPVGLRLRPQQLQTSQSLLASLQGTAHRVMLCHWQPEDIAAIAAALAGVPQRQIFLEVTSLEQAQCPQLADLAPQGLIARGQESGGWGGQDPAFILVQKLVTASPYPVYLQGAVGVHTAAACRLAGAAGIVIDDSLWLMPESPLPKTWQQHLTHLSGQEAIVVGERSGAPVRILSRPGFKAVEQLLTLAEQTEMAETDTAAVWEQQALPYVGWGPPGEKAWPIGQGIGLAARARDRYHTTGRYLQALKAASQQQIELAQQQQSLSCDGPLARSHRTAYPIVQGPMTRVSDTAEFAAAVSQAGALPLLALALMRQPQVETLLHQAQTLLQGQAWGVGILGFVPHALREAQLQVIRRIRPPFALIAGGRPDQAAQLEELGIATYIHVPTPQLLSLFLEQGTRRFVFEGRECGGHVGPLSSFVLWESAVATLLAEVPEAEAAQVHVLFAGGIHDGLSAAMVSALAAPLAAKGMKVGVLMGTAYLFTQEAVTCGAIVEGFQQQAIACRQTINLETGPGHASRCAVTPFAHEFYATQRQMRATGKPADAIKNTLEDLTLGRLRIATKGIRRQADSLTTVAPEQQLTDGMYMIGQVATLREQVGTLADLHRTVSEGSQAHLNHWSCPANAPSALPVAAPSDIAIIGVSTLLPGAQTPDIFWENILKQTDAITEVPAQRWDWRLYYDRDRQAKDKVYSKWGGFLEDVPFDPLYFGIPPNSLKSIEPMQLLALEAVRRALADAGSVYEQGHFDRENTCVILGASGGMADLGGQYAARAELPRVVTHPDEHSWDRLPDWTEESFPGLLMNVIAGRVANRFDLGGSNFTVDAACGSSLAAVDLAVRELESGRAQVAIAGGVDGVQSPFAYFCFSKTQALSPQGKARTFDQAADGIVISEGVAMVVLKRLADARRDGDRIYATLKAVASSSDGKGLSMTAPASSGQKRAFQRAYQKAGFSPQTLGLYEAHGTGTVAGDRTELASITSLLQEHHTPPKSCAVGSVKTTVGHTKSAAGVVALVKTALSLYHRVLPPHSHVETPLEPLSRNDSPVYLLKAPQPWLQPAHHPRRAALSSFGFGGTNFHAVIEEYADPLRPPVLGAHPWPWELILLRETSPETLAAAAIALHQALANGAQPRLQDLAYSCALQAAAKSPQSLCLSLVVESLAQLQEGLEMAIAHLQAAESSPLPPHIHIQDARGREAGKIAFLFPGQVAQYPGMAREVALYFPEMRRALEQGAQQLKTEFSKPLTQFIYPPSAFSEEQKAAAKEQLTNTHVAQPIIGTVEAGYMDIVARLGLQPDMVAGHSYGEYAALHAAGVLDRENFLRLSEIRGRVMSRACDASDGAMAAVQATREELLAHLEGYEDVTLANHNAPLQAVISGKTAVVRKIVERLQVADIMARMLPVAGAFHSSLVESAQTALTAAVSTVPMEPPRLPVYSNTTARPYEPDVDKIRRQLSQHLLSSVEFVEQINAMYQAGTRVFIELGPKSILTKLTSQILEGRPHTAVPIDGHRNLQGFLITLGTLFAQGIALDIAALFAGRDVRSLNLSRLGQEKPNLSPSTWLINGGGARPLGETANHPGKQPPLTWETAMAASGQNGNGNGNSNGASAHTMASAIAKAADAARPHALTATPLATPTSAHSTPPVSAPPPSPAMLNPPRQPVISTSTTMNAPSSSPTPAASPASPSGTLSDASLLGAYQAYQHTMRQFLGLQEKVMTQFLTGASLPSTSPLPISNSSIAAPAPAALPVEVPVAVPPAPAVAPPSPPIAQESPAPVMEGPAAAAARPDRSQLLQLLIELVSDRTGYPPEMLGPDQDMEAELGIDSIKRVEIFAALQKQLPSTLADALKERTEQFTQVKTLNGLVAGILAESGATASPAPAGVAPPSEAPPTEAAALNHSTLLQTLVDLVSERTGYPPEMLGPDQDMEAELGIDSIKRVEIFAALQKRLPSAIATQLTGQTEAFTQVKTLNGLIDRIMAGTPATASQEGSTRLGKSSAPSQPCQRYLTQGQRVPLPPGGTSDRPVSLSGLWVITADGFSVATQLASRLQSLGVAAAILPTSVLPSRDSIEQAVRQLRQRHGPVAGIVHLAGLARLPLPDTLEEWRTCAQVQAKSLFHLLQICAEDLRQHQGQVITTSLLGGHWGRDGRGRDGSALAGAGNGLLKTMGIEWPTVRAKAIDFDPACLEQIAPQLLAELAADDTPLEIGYPQNQRTVFDIAPVPLPSAAVPGVRPIRPESDWVVLAIGGARGITAEVVEELLVPGMTLILVGRSPQPETESALTQGIEEVGLLRQRLIQQARSLGQSPTPSEVEGQIQQLRRDRAIQDHLQRFAQAGVAVEYYSLDVTQARALVPLLEQIYDRFGRLDAVIQGAGIIQDKRLVDKTAPSFDTVFHTKVDSTYLLARHLRPQTLKLVILFASIAGRTGNQGQCDYAAANEVVNRLAGWMAQQWSQTRVLSINWGPWDITGMASEAVNRQFRERGVIPIEPAAGRQFVVTELQRGSGTDVELMAGTFHALSGSDRPSASSPFPLLTAVPELQPNGTVTARQVLSLVSYPFLRDHKIDGKPVLAAACALELMAEFVQAAWPDWVVCEVHALQVLCGIVLETAAGRTVQLQAQASTHADATTLEVVGKLIEPESQRRFYRARFILRPQLPPSPSDSLPVLSQGQGLEVSRAYQSYCFHGPQFQRLNTLDQFSEAGVNGTATPTDPADWLGRAAPPMAWLFDPGLVDAALQIGLMWTHTYGQTGNLPCRFGRVKRYGAFSSARPVQVVWRRQRFDPPTMISDVLFMDSRHRVLLQLEDIEVTCSQALNRLTPTEA